MHNLLVAFFSFLFSFGSAAPTHPSDAFVPPAQYADTYGAAIPSHDQIVNGNFGTGYSQEDASAIR
jgi:hypothetical protein